MGAAELINRCIKCTWHYWCLRRAEEARARARAGGGGAGEGKEGEENEEEDEENEEDDEGGSGEGRGGERRGSELSPCGEMLTTFTTFLADLLAKKFVKVEEGKVEGNTGMNKGLTLSRLAKSMAIVNFSADQVGI